MRLRRDGAVEANSIIIIIISGSSSGGSIKRPASTDRPLQRYQSGRA